MAKKKVAAIIKIQIPGRQGNTRRLPSVPRSDRTASRIMDFVKQYNAATESQVRHDHPRRDHRLRRPHVHLHPEDHADSGAAAAEGRCGQGFHHDTGQDQSPAR